MFLSFFTQVASGDFPHMMFFGPSGAGKKTLIMALLKELYGPGVERVKVSPQTFQINAKTVEINTIGSNYHIEMNPSDAGNNDIHVVQSVITELANTQTLKTAGQGAKNFKVVILNEVDRLSVNAQHALRRTMEKYMATCRIILCSESACRVTAPLRSRCLGIRVPAPDAEAITTILQAIALKEMKQNIPADLAQRLVDASQLNLRKAILLLESCKAQAGPNQPLVAGQPLRLADWERFVDELGLSICEEQSPTRLLLARAKVYELLTNCIPADVIMKQLSRVLMRRLDDELKHEVIKWAAFYEHRLKTGSKVLPHVCWVSSSIFFFSLCVCLRLVLRPSAVLVVAIDRALEGSCYCPLPSFHASALIRARFFSRCFFRFSSTRLFFI